MMSAAVCRWLFLLISLATWTTITSTKEMRVVCYYTNWSVYRPGGAKFNPQNINPYLCTHLVYAFGGFTKENTLKPFDKYQDIEKGGYAKFTGLKTYNKNLKTMLAIGGWNEGSSRFSPMVANAERRKELVKNTIKFLRQNHFDGLDLDWEYPTFRDGGKSRDRDNYAQLVEELRQEFDRESEKTGRPRLILTMAVPAGIEYINKGYDVPKLMEYLDWMNILSYDYHSAFEPAVNHHAPLYSLEEDDEYNYDAELNIDYTIKHYMKLGADPHKLVLGIPTYGRSYTLYNPDAFEIGSPADGPGEMGEATRENGYLAYYEICDYVKNQGWEVEQPNPSAMGPYAYKDNQWVGYDDEDVVRKKSEYVAENGLGGIMFWAIDNDDFRGNCHGKPYPLIEAAKEALLNAYGIADDNLISPPSKPKSRPRSRTKTAGKIKTKDEEETKVEKVEKVSNSGGSRRRNRLKSKAKEEGRESARPRQKNRRKDLRATTEAPTTHSSLKVVTPSYTTPAPPSTPELDGAFKCEDEGFFPHPKDCKKYFWCLSGAGDSGIIAHQFTCPAGLYFNKAADSCDYTQNVLCNKKLPKPTTTTTAGSTTTTTTPASALFSTSRVPPKITAATSRTTYKVSTTTEAYEDEYEYDDEEEEEEDEKEDKIKIDAEEDPKVIKELIELIKKAGGIEELEKQLSGSKPGTTSPSSDSTTPSGISKSLYERVLNKAVKNTLNSKKNPLAALRNSRGPQSDGLSQKDESSSTSNKADRGKLQYTSISRKRPTTEKYVDDEEDDEDEEEEVKEVDTKTRRPFSKKYQPEYVTIRRPRVSSTTEAGEIDSSLNRNRILGETSDEEYDDDDIDEDDEDDDAVEEDESTRKQNTPQYVNIRRQRPSTSTTEETATSKYAILRRGSTSTTESASEANEETTSSKYKTIRRGSAPTTTPTTTTIQENSSNRYQIRRGTTVSTTSSTVSDGATSRFKNFRRGSTTPKQSENAENTTSSDNSENEATTPLDDENDVTPRSTVARQGSTETPEINISQYQIINRSSTTTQPEIDTVATIAVSAAGLSPVTSAGIIPTTLSGDEGKITTLANIIDDIPTSEPSTTVKSEILSNDTEKPSEVSKPDKSTETAEKTPNSSTTESPDNVTEISQKNPPQLLEPRPFSVFSRSTVKTTITEPTIQNSKVSQSNFKFRLKPKTSDLHDTSNVQTSTTTESPVSKNNYRSRNRAGSRFSLNKQNANANEEHPQDDADAKIKTRKRVSTTEKYVEENRTFRPSELADLSSLTAVDFEQIKELNFGRGTHKRRGRPNTSAPVTTTESVIEEAADESLRTSSRTLPLARKLIDTSLFGANKRIIPNKIDQINSSSEITATKRIRGFGSRTTRQPSTTESSDVLSKINESPSSETVNVTPRSRRVVRRFRTTSRPLSLKDASSNGKTNEFQSFRRRTFGAKNVNQTETIENATTAAPSLISERQSPLQKLFSKKPTRLPFVIQKNDVEEENDDSAEDTSTEEGENIKLSESNIRENSDVNSYDVGGKQNRRVFKLIRPKSDILHGKGNSEKGKIESGKITLPLPTEEPAIEENKYSRLNTTMEKEEVKTLEIKTTTENNVEVDSTVIPTEETTTETIKVTTRQPRVIKTSTSGGRTRKIIRKLKSTTAATVTTDRTTTTEPTTGRKRKIIRRLRPKPTIKNNLESSGLDLDIKNKTDLTFTRDNQTSSDINNHTEEVTAKHTFRPLLTKAKSKNELEESNSDVNSHTQTDQALTNDNQTAPDINNREENNPNVNNQTQTDQIVTDISNQTEKEVTAKHIFRPSLTRPKSKYIKIGSEQTATPEEVKPPARIALRKLPNRNLNIARQNFNNNNKNSTQELDKTKLIFRPKLSALRSKYKSLVEKKSDTEENLRRIPFKPFVRSTTTVKNEVFIETTTEHLKKDSDYVQKALNEETSSEKDEETTTDKSDENSTTESVQVDSKQLFKSEINLPENNLGSDVITVDSHDVNTEITNIVDNSITTVKSTDSGTQNYFTERDIVSTTIEEDLSNITDSVTESSSTTEYTEASDIINESTTAEEESLEEVASSTIVNNPQTAPFSVTESNKREHTTNYNGHDNENDEDDDDNEETSDEPEEKNRNYITVFRSSTTTNSFKDFDSESDAETPKFEDLFEDKDSHKDLYEDDIKFDDHTEFSRYTYNHHDGDDDDFYKYDDDDSKLVGDTSTEFKSAFAYTPNDIIKEEKTEAQPIETSSIKNHFYHPHRPSFNRPKITFSTTEKQTSQRPKYKSFTRTASKTLTKETVQIRSFNNTDEDGAPEKGINKVLFTNRYKYKTLERTTSSPEIINLIDTNDNDTSSEDDSFSEGTTTHLHIISTEENVVTTQSTDTKSVENITTETNSLSQTTMNDEPTFISTNLDTDITTQQNSDNVESKSELTTMGYPTVESEISTVTDGSMSQTETIFSTSELTTTESFTIAEENNQSNTNLITASTEITLEPLDTTTEIPLTTNNIDATEPNETTSEKVTTVSPETTTPYRRKSTLRPINARPKYKPIRRKNTYTPSATIEQSEESYKKKNKFQRNRYQKSTTERISPDSSDISDSPNRIEKSSTPTLINKSLYKHSTTSKSVPTEREAYVEEDKNGEEEVGINEEKPPQLFIEQENNAFRVTSVVPVSEYIFTHSTTEINKVNNEENDADEADEEKEDVESDGDTLTQENDEREEEENLDDEPIIRPSSESSVKPAKPRVSNSPLNTNKRRPNSPVRSNSPLLPGRSTTTRVVNRPVFGKTTETAKINEDLSGIDTEAVKNRNKNLFSKHRKVNSSVNTVSASPPEELEVEVTTNAAVSLEVVTNSQDHITLAPPVTEIVTKAQPETENITTPPPVTESTTRTSLVTESVTETSPITESVTKSSAVTDSVSKASIGETTEYLTTLHHIFAEVGDNETSSPDTTTESLNASVTSTTGKIERLIEVNRIVEVKSKGAKIKNHVVQEQPTAEVVLPVLDKIGEVNRITVIKVVDGNDTIIQTINSQDNEIKSEAPISPVFIPEEVTTTQKSKATTLPDLPFVEHPAKVEEVPPPNTPGNINLTDITVTIDKIADLLQTHSREERKFEIPSKSNDANNNNQIVSEKKTEIIDGMSHINVITPRPIFTEASTIALEGLFQTEATQSTNIKNGPYEELLETEHSKFVNVRVLHPDENFGKGIRDKSKLLPIKLLKQDEAEATLRAKVVEVKAKSNLDTIRIAPIKVEMSKRISDSLPILRVTPQDTKTEYT